MNQIRIDVLFRDTVVVPKWNIVIKFIIKDIK